MSLDSPFWVYGTVTEQGDIVNNAVILILDVATGLTVTQNTDSDGMYNIDIEDIANDADELITTVTTPDGYIQTASRILDISGPNLNIDFDIITPCIFTITTDTVTVYLHTPEVLTFSDGRLVTELNLWNDLFVFDSGKDAENIGLSGMETVKTVLDDIDGMLDRGEEMTITGFINSDFNGVWAAESFSITRDLPGGYIYNLSLERIR